MIWTLLFCLVSLTDAVNNGSPYKVHIDHGVLRNISGSEEIAHLALSSMQIKILPDKVFFNMSNLKSLDLSNNSISEIPLNVFSNLKNLEYLSLARTHVGNISHRLTTLNHLKTLNLTSITTSNLALWKSIESKTAALGGLPDNAEILTSDGSLYGKLRPTMFNVNQSSQIGWRKDLDYKCYKKTVIEKSEFPSNKLNQSVMLCMSGGAVSSVEIKSEVLPKNCTTLGVLKQSLQLNNTKIKSLKKDWYRSPENYGISRVILDENHIEEINETLLNDLPKNIIFVSLKGNKIKLLRDTDIKNNYVKYLKLRTNRIGTIGNCSFRNMKSLKSLDLSRNKIVGVNFISSLSNTVEVLNLESNQITNLPNDIFSHLTYLYDLRLAHNYLTDLDIKTFSGLSSLNTLILHDNEITGINRGLFDDLVCAEQVNLNYNDIQFLEHGFARKMNNLVELSLLNNRHLQIMHNGLFFGLPLNCSVTGITSLKSLQPGVFKNY